MKYNDGPCGRFFDAQDSIANADNYCYAGVKGIYLKGECHANCTEICTDPTLLFASSESFFACQNTYLDPKWSDNSYMLSEEFGRTLQITSRHINSCMEEYCVSPDPALGGCPRQNITLTTTKNYQESRESRRSLCTVVKTVNTDIGGLGVTISYSVQTLVGWVVWAILLYLSRHQSNSGRMIDIKSTRRKQRHSIIKSIIFEFQEAQCFFTIAMQCATFAARRGNNLLKSTSAMQLEANCRFIAASSQLSLVMTVIGWLMVGVAQLSSTYIGLLSLSSSGMSLGQSGLLAFAGLDTVCADSSESIWHVSPVHLQIKACGNGSPPNILCLDDQTKELGTITFATFLLSLYLILVSTASSYINHRNHVQAAKKNSAPKLTRWITWTILIALCATGLLLYEFTRFYDIGYIDVQERGIGQIIAVFMWVPVIARWLYWSCWGMESYSKVRIALPYQILDPDDLSYIENARQTD